MQTLKQLGLSLADFNASQLAPWRLPYYFESLFNRASASGRAMYFGAPQGLDGLTDPNLIISNLAVDYSQLGSDDKAKIDEVCFNKLALKAYDVIRTRGNPSVGENIDFLYSAVDSENGGLLLSDEGKSYVVRTIKAAIYSQVQTWMLNNPFERTNSSSFSSNSGQSYSIDASNWLSNWDQLCTETKTIISKSRLYSVVGQRDAYSEFWKTDPTQAIEFTPTTSGVLKDVTSANPVVLQDYVDLDDASIVAMESRIK